MAERQGNFSVDRTRIRAGNMNPERELQLERIVREVEGLVRGGEIEDVGQIAAEFAHLYLTQQELFAEMLKSGEFPGLRNR